MAQKNDNENKFMYFLSSSLKIDTHLKIRIYMNANRSIFLIHHSNFFANVIEGKLV